ncbi:PREDICTED: 39S ribosomal protein L19, mitochondrial [Nicrophorus vespilloides]|uniref:Large ribosomal subunit protein bL19m n=1 Tax=Nicrophorus vespilloides TaxID=110193 RepID=A0ABM1NC18_NICVS|nr:PREDICTED: 39S ribosomal protein L19, mitochondrial [Nicrophorus vespilloides]
MLSFISKKSNSIASNTRNFLRHSTSSQALKPTEEVNSSNNKPKDGRKSYAEFRHIYPEFLPDPKIEFRNSIREKLERSDMIARRTLIDIPEFYVGTIMAVTVSDKHTPGKPLRFVGICIKREGCGLRSTFILRNVVDHQGVEVMYELYDPTIQKIEVLRLEKRLDDELLYLRDSLSEFSTFDSNMEAEILAEGTPVPVNPIKVQLKPRPWLERWERKNLKGVEKIDLPEKFFKRAAELAKPYEKYDLMKQYMGTIPEEEQNEIFAEIQSQLHKLEVTRKKMKRKRTFVKPTKLA